MAEVAVPAMSRHHRQRSSINSINVGAIPTGAPKIDMHVNPDFSFPMQPQRNASPRLEPTSSRRPMSMQLDPAKMNAGRTGMPVGHKRAHTALPDFSFNNQDASGLKDSPSQPITPTDLNAPSSKKGHKRGGSEFVGGDSRFGVTNALSSSPTKANALPVPIQGPFVAPPGPPSGRRVAHKHRRSAAVSSHDVKEIMNPTEPEPRLSSSLPSTPLYHPGHAHAPSLERATTAPVMGEGPQRIPDIEVEDTSERPQSGRGRSVVFSDKIAIIPRPLSIVSSETESSVGSPNEHSHNNSISSVMSLSSPSPPSHRAQKPSLSPMPEDEPRSKPRSSAEISRAFEREGQWLRSVSAPDLNSPRSETATTPTSIKFADQEQPQATPRVLHRKRHSLGHALGFDRRRSEPSISMNRNSASRLSAISLQETSPSRTPQPEQEEKEQCDVSHKSSTRKIKSWAFAKISRKSKDHTAHATEPQRPPREPHAAEEVNDVKVSSPAQDPDPVAETDLDAVFGNQNPFDESERVGTQSRAVYEVNAPTPSQYSWTQQASSGDSSPVVDLDAALGPLRTPQMASGSHRRQLHSSRGGKDFSGGLGGTHQRALSLPVLTPFENPARIGTPSQSSMADVFEEDEDEESKSANSSRPTSTLPDESKMGVSIVDSASSQPMQRMRNSFADGLGIQPVGWEMERPSTSHGPNSRLSTPINMDRRASLVEETIIEEASPVESPQAYNQRVEIVADDEAPRASSLTKSSDGSETPTLLAPSQPPNSTLHTPEIYPPSSFSSPDLSTRRRSSFEASPNTTASSITDDRRTTASSTYISSETSTSNRISVDDVPSLTSSRSTMMSNILAPHSHPNNSRRDFSDRSISIASVSNPAVQDFAAATAAAAADDKRKKRSSIQGLSQLMGGSFHGKHPRPEGERPATTTQLPMPMEVVAKPGGGKKNKQGGGLKKLMFWKSKGGESQTGAGGGGSSGAGKERRHRSVSGM